MDMSFKEKSAWISLLTTIAIFGYYFFNIWGLSGVPEVEAREQAKDLLAYVIILTIIVETVFHSMLAATNHKAAKLGADERDKLLEYKSNNIGYTILAVGVVIVIGRMVFLEFNTGFTDYESSLQIPFLTIHMLILVFILSEVGRFGALVFHYRRGL